MPNVHTPERLEGESPEEYKLRRLHSKQLFKKSQHPELFGRTEEAIRHHVLNPKIKNTKHTRTAAKYK